MLASRLLRRRRCRRHRRVTCGVPSQPVRQGGADGRREESAEGSEQVEGGAARSEAVCGEAAAGGAADGESSPQTSAQQ